MKNPCFPSALPSFRLIKHSRVQTKGARQTMISPVLINERHFGPGRRADREDEEKSAARRFREWPLCSSRFSNGRPLFRRWKRAGTKQGPRQMTFFRSGPSAKREFTSFLRSHLFFRSQLSVTIVARSSAVLSVLLFLLRSGFLQRNFCFVASFSRVSCQARRTSKLPASLDLFIRRSKSFAKLIKDALTTSRIAGVVPVYRRSLLFTLSISVSRRPGPSTSVAPSNLPSAERAKDRRGAVRAGRSKRLRSFRLKK